MFDRVISRRRDLANLPPGRYVAVDAAAAELHMQQLRGIGWKSDHRTPDWQWPPRWQGRVSVPFRFEYVHRARRANRLPFLVARDVQEIVYGPSNPGGDPLEFSVRQPTKEQL